MKITKAELRRALTQLWRKDDIELARWVNAKGYEQVKTVEATDRLWQHMKEQGNPEEGEE